MITMKRCTLRWQFLFLALKFKNLEPENAHVSTICITKICVVSGCSSKFLCLEIPILCLLTWWHPLQPTPPLPRPYPIDQNIFAQFITFQDSKIMTRKFSFVDDGRTKPKPRKERGGASQEPTEHKCLIRAQLGSKKITTVVSVLWPV